MPTDGGGQVNGIRAGQVLHTLFEPLPLGTAWSVGTYRLVERVGDLADGVHFARLTPRWSPRPLVTPPP